MADIELAQMIIDFRKTLETAQNEGEGKSIQFLVNETELELYVKMADEGEAGIKFYVFQAGGGVATEQSQKIKIKLQPVTKVDGKYRKLTIADEDTR